MLSTTNKIVNTTDTEQLRIECQRFLCFKQIVEACNKYLGLLKYILKIKDCLTLSTELDNVLKS